MNEERMLYGNVGLILGEGFITGESIFWNIWSMFQGKEIDC